LSKSLPVIFILALICLFTVKSNPVFALGTFALTPPYSYGAHYVFQPNGGSSQAVINRLLGTGFVKAKPAAPPLLSSALYSAISGITFITSEWKIGGTNQTGTVIVKAQLQNLQISSPAGIPASLEAWLAMEDFTSNGSLFNAQFTELFSTTTSHSSPVDLNNSTNWTWLNNHLYRAVVFLIAAGVGARTYASSAQTNFTLTSITWNTPVNFSTATGVYCKDGNNILYDNISVLLIPGQPILLQGCLGLQNANSKASVTLIDTHGDNINATPHNGVPTDGFGNFSASIPAPKLPNGPYVVKVGSMTGNYSEDIVDFTFGILPAPSLEPVQLIPILAVLALFPCLVRWSRKSTLLSLIRT
jgi:hypothetical protein